MLSLKIALRFLKSGRTQTTLITVGIAVAISIQLFVGLLIDSLQKSLVAQTVGNSPQVTVSSSADSVTIPGWQQMLAQITQVGGIDAVSATASASAFATKGSSTLPVLVRGFDFDSADRIYDLRGAIYQGRPYRSGREVLVGRELSEELEVELGDDVLVSAPGRSAGVYSIAGLYDLGTASINKAWVIADLKTAQRAFGYGDRVTSIEVTVGDVFAADAIAATIEERLDDEDIAVENWKDQNEDLLSALDSQGLSSTIIQAVILLSVVIAIASILAITVLQKYRQIGILKAMGIKNRAASLIFLYQGAILGLGGSALGVALGLGLFLAFGTFATNPDGSPVVPPFVDYELVLRSWLIALLASTAAGIIPARRSLRLNPIDVIREG